MSVDKPSYKCIFIVETILSGYAGPIVETVVPQQAVVMATHPLCLRSCVGGVPRVAKINTIFQAIFGRFL